MKDLIAEIKPRRHSYDMLAELRRKRKDVPVEIWNRAIKEAA